MVFLYRPVGADRQQVLVTRRAVAGHGTPPREVDAIGDHLHTIAGQTIELAQLPPDCLRYREYAADLPHDARQHERVVGVLDEIPGPMKMMDQVMDGKNLAFLEIEALHVWSVNQGVRPEYRVPPARRPEIAGDGDASERRGRRACEWACEMPAKIRRGDDFAVELPLQALRQRKRINCNTSWMLPEGRKVDVEALECHRSGRPQGTRQQDMSGAVRIGVYR